MKRILLSAGMIAVVAALAIGGTIAFYNDTETSTGNIFTAGSIDLKVDHLAQTYNGIDCKTCSVNVFSSTATQVTSGTGAYVGGYPTNAVELTFIHPAWLPEASISPAQWIWVTNPVLAADTTNNAEYTFKKTFNWNGNVSGVTLDLALAADNGYKIVFNGIEVANALGTETNYGALVNTTAAEALMLPQIQNGVNTLEITVRNKAVGGSSPASNPAGLIFDLNIQRANCQDDSAFQNACRLWTEKDLGQGDTFFSFNDVKPADWGTNVISLHVYNNDAYACLIESNKNDQEHSLLETEIEDGDGADVGNANGDGDLSDYIDVFTWVDANGDGLFGSGETPLAGPASLQSFGSLASLDPTTESHLTATTTQKIGLAWCAGTLIANAGGDFECDGDGMPNRAQSDSFSANLTAYAEQVRNNSGFTCASIASQPPYASE